MAKSYSPNIQAKCTTAVVTPSALISLVETEGRIDPKVVKGQLEGAEWEARLEGRIWVTQTRRHVERLKGGTAPFSGDPTEASLKLTQQKPFARCATAFSRLHKRSNYEM